MTDGKGHGLGTGHDHWSKRRPYLLDTSLLGHMGHLLGVVLRRGNHWRVSASAWLTRSRAPSDLRLWSVRRRHPWRQVREDSASPMSVLLFGGRDRLGCGLVKAPR